MRPMLAAGVLCALLIAGCGGGGHKQASAPRPSPKPPPAAIPVRKGDERVIRGWNKAENAGDYEHAARYFARNAIVIQSYILPLTNHRFAVEWNSGLPCRADITFIKGEKATTLAGFSLREGPHGQCKEGGRAQVRFTIRRGLIRQWRQLPESEEVQTPAA
jgi:hypothetical protein